ncbi:YccS family putative transporter [Orbaceae bacterium ESL0721]|nr:YccS family putative transporter [Orbaceae bacterium ESL0721]
MLRKVFYHNNLLYSLRILISLTGTTLIPWYFGHTLLVIPLTLGVVAAALTEIDTRPLGRCINLLFILICFSVASFSVQILFDYPYLFIIGLVCSTFIFTLLGSLGQRYAVISFGSLLIAAYTMLGHDMFSNNFILPIFLLIGALWYNIVAIIETLIQPIRATQQNLSSCFNQLANYLDAKAAMFDPDEQQGFQNQTLQLTESNNQLINAFNTVKRSLFNRIKSYYGQTYVKKMVNYYFVAQDIHERASSAHVNYQELSINFKHSDMLFRFGRILNLQAKACRRVATAIKLNQNYVHDPLFARDFANLAESIKQYQERDKKSLLILKSLQNLYNNLLSIDRLLANIDTLQQFANDKDLIVDDELSGFRDIFIKIKNNLTLKSALFRHAIRMSLVFFIGYMIIHFTPLSHGYWIILTSLFVCQPNYSTTKHRLQLRVLGTILGIIIGVPLTYIFPTVEAQLFLIVLSGWLFFLFKNSQYAYATAFITLLVFFSFSLAGESSIEVAIARIVATIIGCIIAWLAVSYIWPDWKFRNLPNIIAHLTHNNCHYLALIGSQYILGKNNDVNYRVARRAVHDSSVDLSTQITIMAKEPHVNTTLINQSFRFLTLNHTFISYLSTLGAHRDQAISKQTLDFFDDISVYIINTLSDIKLGKDYPQIKQTIIDYINNLQDDSTHNDLLVMQQLNLILDILPEMITLIQTIKREAG